MNRKVSLGLLFLLGMFGLLLMAALTPARAQDESPGVTVCRDPRFISPIRFEFHDIPQSWLDWGGTAWGYWAEGISQEGNVILADALKTPTDGYTVGTAGVYLGEWSDEKGDWAYKVVGDNNTPLCDVSQSPIHWDNEQILITPSPAPPVTAVIQPSDCPAVYSYPYVYCYTPRPDGLIPLPPPQDSE